MTLANSLCDFFWLNFIGASLLLHNLAESGAVRKLFLAGSIHELSLRFAAVGSEHDGSAGIGREKFSVGATTSFLAGNSCFWKQCGTLRLADARGASCCLCRAVQTAKILL